MGNWFGRRSSHYGRPGSRGGVLVDSSDSDSDSDSSSEESMVEDLITGSCPICFEEKQLSCFYNPESNENFQITPCNHRFCKECFSTHVNTVIDSGTWQVRCPGESCSYVLSAKDVKSILPQPKYEEWKAARNKSYYERFMSNDQEMRDALKVDKLVSKEVKKRKRAEEAKVYWKEKRLKLDDATRGHVVRVKATYMGSSGPRYNGTVLEVDDQNETASIAYDDGDFWGFAPLTSIQILPRLHHMNTERISQEYEDAFDELEPLEEHDIFVGKRVTARLRDGSFYPGVITSVNKKRKTAAIDYDDGDEWDSCPFQLIREDQSSIKCCPQCAVIIHKYDGCDSMTCLCGENFNWTNCRTIPSKLLDELVERELKKTILVQAKEMVVSVVASDLAVTP
uniref:RING-type domain-containing protein n=1 Tax=Helicotheca tamesis TaxID=374047 RepID=A0A7S2DWQ6_9STRA|mmetsp:Transcript_1036/g.1473  ORF Transcript_1036/g.1473 Transcript_1036/m.1473 type:complete len:396 (+) Transcript_1036:129-1316(+)